MRRSVRAERGLDAPPEPVFEVLADHARYDRFDGIRRAELIEPGDADPNGVGALRRVWIGPWVFDERITAYEPPSRIDYLITNVRGLPYRHEGGSIRLTPRGTGTDAVWTSEYEIPIPIIGRAMEALLADRLESGFGATLERSAQLAGPPLS